MNIKIQVYDETKTSRKIIATFVLPASDESAAATLIEFATSNFSLGVTKIPSDYYAGLRAMFYALLSAHYIQGLVVVTAEAV